jgi:hypothetical protein
MKRLPIGRSTVAALLWLPLVALGQGAADRNDSSSGATAQRHSDVCESRRINCVRAAAQAQGNRRGLVNGCTVNFNNCVRRTTQGLPATSNLEQVVPGRSRVTP